MGISEIIADLTGAGRDGGVVACPFCNGGSRQRRTLSVNLRDGVWLWFCHRATCNAKGAVAAIGTGARPITTSAFVPRPLDAPLRLPSVLNADPIAIRLDPLVGSIEAFSFRHFLRVLSTSSDVHAWGIFNVWQEFLGHVTRDEAKYIKTWRIKDGPFYAMFFPRGSTSKACVIVEDPLSAALLAEEGVRAIALLGTNLSREAATEIVNGLGTTISYTVALDDDSAGILATGRVRDRLRTAGAKDVRAAFLITDVKNMSVTARREFADAVREGRA